MAICKYLLVASLAAIAHCEPPVQAPYNYNPPSSNYRAPNQRAPSTNYGAPNNHANSNYRAPSSNYGAPSYHAPSAHSSAYQAPSASHSASSSSYHAPSGNYHAPSASYGAPSGFSAPSSSYGAPSAGHGAPNTGYGAPTGHGGSYNNHDHGHDNEVPKAYEFGYSVKDAQSGNDYGRQEVSDGNTVRGEYRVQLPDGRVQIVTYHADWQTGFHADVRYEGEAQYPEQTHGATGGYLPPQQQVSHNYNAPSDFSGSLTGFQGNNAGYNKPNTAYGPPGYQH